MDFVCVVFGMLLLVWCCMYVMQLVCSICQLLFVLVLVVVVVVVGELMGCCCGCDVYVLSKVSRMRDGQVRVFFMVWIVLYGFVVWVM